MEINVFEGVNKDELSMIEVAHAILEQKADVMDFSDLVNQIQGYLGKSDSEIRDSLAQFYTDLNINSIVFLLMMIVLNIRHHMK